MITDATAVATHNTSQERAASQQLLSMIKQRAALRPAFEMAWTHLIASRNADEMEAWSFGVLALIHVNAGIACLTAYWTLSTAFPNNASIDSLVDVANAATDICRHAGARAATATLNASTTAQRILKTPRELSRWWETMKSLATQAAESVEPIASRIELVLESKNIVSFEDFVAAGIKYGAGNRRKRYEFFALEEATSRRLLNRSTSQIGFTETERATKAFVTALWGDSPALRRLSVADAQLIQRRSAIAGPLILLPEIYRGVADDAAPALYRAATAHAQAHLVLGGPRFVVGKLKPLQVALVSLVEDARIETLAMRQLPGLRRLWSPYHVAIPAGVATAPGLMARLARALFDPSHADTDGFVVKGRKMFVDAASRLDDPAISRDIGMLLGNDLGQMRVQFNSRTYVVEPIYRDDGMGLWDFGDNADASEQLLDVRVDVARKTWREQLDGNEIEPENAKTEGDVGRAKPGAPDACGVVLATYPEWDRAHGNDRPDWTTVREVAPKLGDPAEVDNALGGADILRARIRRLVGNVRVGRTTRMKRQLDGHDLDIDAMLDAGIALATGKEPDPRVFRSTMAKHRDLAVLVLIDTSESTRDRLASGASVLDVERLAVAVLAEAMDSLGDPFCLLAFASNGRDDVELTEVKGFHAPYDRSCVARLAGLSSGLSTRLGAALRHAGATVGPARSFRKLVIVLTDGEPSDIDVVDPQELIEDARRAALGLKSEGIDAFGVVLDPKGMSTSARIFGPGNTMLVHRVEELPARLSELYFRLARR